MKATVRLRDEELVCQLAEQETTELKQRLCCCSSLTCTSMPPNMTTGATRELQVAAGPFPLGHLSVKTTKTSKSNYGKGEKKYEEFEGDMKVQLFEQDCILFTPGTETLMEN